MGYNPFSKFPQITHLKYKPSHTNKMNPATVFSAVVAVLSVGSANAIFGADIITATGASSGLGTSVILASGPGIPAAAAVVGAGLLLRLVPSLSSTKAEPRDLLKTLMPSSPPLPLL